MSDHDILKARLRVEARVLRRSLQRNAPPGYGAAIADQFFAHVPWRAGLAVSGYAPTGEEADVMPLLARLAERGLQTALPVVEGRHAPLQFRRWRPGDILESGAFGIDRPGADQSLLEPDIVLVPLLAFDDCGARLGYGGGYYDRTLAELRRKKTVLAVGIAFSGQQWDSLPQHADDQKLDWVVTEQAALEIAR